MKPVAGRWEIDRPVHNDATTDQDRTPAPVDQVALFMAANLRHCQQLAARISPQQCQLNRKNALYLCGKCTAPITGRSSVPAVPVVPAAKTDKAPPWLKQRRKSGSTASVEPPASDQSEPSDPSPVFLGVDLAAGPDRSAVVLVDAVAADPAPLAVLEALEALEVPVVPEPQALSDDTRVILRLLAFRHGNQTAMGMTLAGGL